MNRDGLRGCHGFLMALVSCVVVGLLHARPTEVVMWVMKNESMPNVLSGESLRVCTATNGSIILKHQMITWDSAYLIFSSRRTFAAETIKRGGCPNIIQVPSTWSAHLIHEDLLFDLTEETLVSSKSYAAPVRQTCEVDGRVYAVPWFLDVRALYYRKDILSRETLDESNLATWDALKSTCIRIQNARIHLRPDSVRETGKKILLPDSNGARLLMPLGITVCETLGWGDIGDANLFPKSVKVDQLSG